MDEEDIKFMEELAQKRQSEEKSEAEEPSSARAVAKGFLGFFLTIIGIPAVMFGTCMLNMQIYDHLGDDSIIPLYIAWFGFPVLLFGFIAWLTKNIWVIYGLLCFILVIFIYWLANL